MRNKLTLSICILIFLFSCSTKQSEKENTQTMQTIVPADNAEVTTLLLQPKEFHYELISNGKISSSNSSNLHFQSSEIINHIWVKNGDRVKKGQKLAELDKFKLENKLLQSADDLERTRLDLHDVLIGQGYSPNEQDKIPAATMQLAKVKSGYDRSKASYELTEYEVKNSVLIAPFDGIVANLFAKPYNQANPSEVFCTIIDNAKPEVNFTILESELLRIKPGDKVQVSPFSSKEMNVEGVITEINPLVDANGMVKVKARVNNNGKLFEGMNVRVIIQRTLSTELIVPKSAVVLRSGKQVVFTYQDGKAMWNYVKTGLENMENYTILEGLNEGDVVIVSGNVNLAHETPVEVTK